MADHLWPQRWWGRLPWYPLKTRYFTISLLTMAGTGGNHLQSHKSHKGYKWYKRWITTELLWTFVLKYDSQVAKLIYDVLSSDVNSPMFKGPATPRIQFHSIRKGWYRHPGGFDWTHWQQPLGSLCQKACTSLPSRFAHFFCARSRCRSTLQWLQVTSRLFSCQVCITWIGYPHTTGLTRMDYRISDEWWPQLAVAVRDFWFALVSLVSFPVEVRGSKGCSRWSLASFSALLCPLSMCPGIFLEWRPHKRKRSSTCRTVAGGLEMNMLAV